MSTKNSSPLRAISKHGFAEVRRNLITDQNCLVALRPFVTGEVIQKFLSSAVLNEPSYLTVQTGIRKHILLQPEFLQYINHHCEPNVFFNTKTFELIALKEIKAEDEFGFFYPSTEWKMTQAFNCYCNSPSCIGLVRGAAYLAPELISQYNFTEFIHSQLSKKMARNKVVLVK